MNEGKLKFLQITQDTIRQNMKRDSVSAYVHMRRDTPLPLYTPVHILDDPLHSPSYVHIYWTAYFSTKRQIRTFEYRIHRNINIRKKNYLQKNK